VNSYLEIIQSFSKLGFTAFGGPIAHLAFFREEFVGRRQWLDEAEFADLVAFCQFLPGPASSQVAISLGYKRAGIAGGLLSFLSFSLPSVIFLILFAIGVSKLKGGLPPTILHSLKLVALAVVLHALWKMGNKILTSKSLFTIAGLSAALLLFYPFPLFQVLIILIAACFGATFYRNSVEISEVETRSGSGKSSLIWASLFLALLLITPLFLSSHHLVEILYGFYYSGSLVFGGGHVVLPLLESTFVPPGWIERDLFLAGYGMAQAVPGPLFTFSAYLGASIPALYNPWLGGFLCLFSIYLPSFFLIFGLLPQWERLRSNRTSKTALKAVNAAVVGLLLSAMYQPMFVSTIHSAQDFALLLLLYILLAVWKLPGWFLILGSGSVAWCLHIL